MRMPQPRPRLQPRRRKRPRYERLGRQLEAESRALFPDMPGRVQEEGRLVPVEEAAELMGRPVAWVQMVAEAGLLRSRRDRGRLLVEPAILA